MKSAIVTGANYLLREERIDNGIWVDAANDLWMHVLENLFQSLISHSVHLGR